MQTCLKQNAVLSWGNLSVAMKSLLQRPVLRADYKLSFFIVLYGVIQYSADEFYIESDRCSGFLNCFGFLEFKLYRFLMQGINTDPITDIVVRTILLFAVEISTSRNAALLKLGILLICILLRDFLPFLFWRASVVVVMC